MRVERVATAPTIAYVGEGYRHMAARWDAPLSGEGARIHGGRFNPPDSFPVLYLCTTRLCVIAEFRHLGDRSAVGVGGLLPRVLYRYQLSLDRVLDLTSSGTLDHLEATTAELTGPDVALPRRIGEAAHTAGLQGVRAPSATGVDQVLALFADLIDPGRLHPERVERWASEADL